MILIIYILFLVGIIDMIISLLINTLTIISLKKEKMEQMF